MVKSFLKAIVIVLMLTSLAYASNEAAEKVDLNTATVKDLAKLPGIGPKTAVKIVVYRKDNGGFKSIEELMKVKGVGVKTYNKIEGLITISEYTDDNATADSEVVADAENAGNEES